MRKIACSFLIFAFIGYITLHLALAGMPASGINRPVSASAVSGLYSLENNIFNFVSNNMIGSGGEIITNLQDSETSRDTLSESVGLLMDYCVLTGKKDLFDREVAFLKKEMLAEGRYIRWRTGKNTAFCNAAVDDFRIISALLDAYDKWNVKEYRDLAGYIQDGIFDSQVTGRDLREFYDWRTNTANHSIPLCYLDLYTMDRVSDFNMNWLFVEENGLSIISGGKVGGKSPFYYKYYDYGTGTYSFDEEYKKTGGICLTYTLYTALHLAEINERDNRLTDFLKNEMKKGRLYAWYDPVTLKPANTVESAAVYALAAVYARKAGEDELCGSLLNSMAGFMVTDRSSKYFGGLGDPRYRYFHSFDNLTALWALALYDN